MCVQGGSPPHRSTLESEVLELVLTFIGLSIIIVVAAVFLANSADEIAEGTKLGRSMAGLILLAGATSLPEFMVGWTGIQIGAYDLTIGELLGSCLLNLLILALMDLVTRTKGSMISRISVAHAISAAASILLAGTVLMSLLMPSNIVIARLSIGSWIIAIVYFACMRLIYQDQMEHASDIESEPSERKIALMKAIPIYLVAATVILFTAPQLAVKAEKLSHMTGLGETFFGTVFVALITSLPELVSTYTAIRLGAFDMAVGNILGSNCINLFIIPLVDAATPKAIFASISMTHALTATSIILITTVTMVGLLYRGAKKIILLEPDAILIICLVLGALYLVYQSPVAAVAH